jgi:hypothetical protein
VQVWWEGGRTRRLASPISDESKDSLGLRAKAGMATRVDSRVSPVTVGVKWEEPWLWSLRSHLTLQILSFTFVKYQSLLKRRVIRIKASPMPGT